jgi:hypothetical protein
MSKPKFKMYTPQIYLWLYSLCGRWQLFQFLNPHTVDRTPWTGDQPVSKLLPLHTEQQKKRGYEPTIPVFERAKTAHALNRAATAIGLPPKYKYEILPLETTRFGLMKIINIIETNFTII